MLDKHLELLKFYAPSKVMTLGAEKFFGESGRSVKTFAKLPGESLAEVMLSGRLISKTRGAGGKMQKVCWRVCGGELANCHLNASVACLKFVHCQEF